MQRSLITLLLFALMLLPTGAQEDNPPDPLTDLMGVSVPQAEAIINREGLRLDPQILLTTVSDGDFNTVTEYQQNDDRVQVTVYREPNIELVWNHREAFVNVGSTQRLDGDELFTFINLSADDIPMRNIQLAEFDMMGWQTTVRGNQCAQIWSIPETEPFQLPPCATIQGGNVTQIDETTRFWVGVDSFEVSQSGIHRGTCQITDNSCQIWVSPSEIAEDLTDYLYVLYNETQLVIVNNSDDQWMDLSQLSIAGVGNLSTTRIYDEVEHPDLERLAPNQCVWFTRNRNADPITNCDVIATFNTSPNEIFWASEFSFDDTVRNQTTLTCPAASGRTVCLLSR